MTRAKSPFLSVSPVDVMGVAVHPVTREELHDAMLCIVREEARALVLNVNAHCMNLAARHIWLKDLLNGAEIVFCDGFGVRLGARLLGHRIPERITYAEWIWDLSAFFAEHGISLFLLGAAPGNALEAAARLRQRCPRLKIAGTHHGYFDVKRGGPENEALLERVNAAAPDVLLVCMGMPRQERWLRENWGRLDAKIALTGGAVLDYVSGALARGPRWMTNHGLEWLARLVIEPRRLWRRYLFGNALFMSRVLRHRVLPRARNRR